MNTGQEYGRKIPRFSAHHYSLVDEADNIFIDEARTPLVIGMGTRPASEESVVYKWADNSPREMIRDQHFYLDEKKRKVDFGLLAATWFLLNPPFGQHSHAMDKLHEHVRRLHANYRFRLDQHT